MKHIIKLNPFTKCAVEIALFGIDMASRDEYILQRPGFYYFRTEAQKRAYLPAMARGEKIGAIAMTEPGAGSDLQSIRTTAKREGDAYVINGSKTYITNGYNANLIVLVCKTNPAEKAKGVSLLLVETDGLEGFRRGKPLKKIGMKGQDTSELFFDDCRVPVGNILGGVEGQGFYQLMNQLGRERLMIGLRAYVENRGGRDEQPA